jgi:hypothetical protein
MSSLFTPLTIRSVKFPHRIFVSPMCQYSSADGLPNEWHMVHLGSRAVGGAALVLVEASGVSPEGRITAWDSGIWSSAHAGAFRPIVDFIHAQGSIAGIQLAHAGRKASTDKPWRGGAAIAEGPHSWQTVAPSAIPFRTVAPRTDCSRDRRHRRTVRRGGAICAERGLPRHRDPRRTWISASRVSVPSLQRPPRRIRRISREQDASHAAGGLRGTHELA